MSFRSSGMKVVTTVCFTEDTYDRLESIREKKCMTRSRYIQEALKAAMDRDEIELNKVKKQ